MLKTQRAATPAHIHKEMKGLGDEDFIAACGASARTVWIRRPLSMSDGAASGRCAKAGGKRLVQPLRQSRPAGGCAEGGHRQYVSGDHKAARRRSRPFEEAGAQASRRATLLGSPLVSEPPGTR